MPQDTPQDRPISLDEFEEQRRQYYGIPKGLAASLRQQESGGQHYDKAGGVLTSPRQAKGRYQVLKSTAAQYGLNADDPFENIEAGFRYMADLHKKVDPKVTDPGERWASVVAGYHSGEGGLNKINRTGNMPATNDGLIKTEDYVSSIMKRWHDYDSRGQGQPAQPAQPQAPAPEMAPIRPVTPETRFTRPAKPVMRNPQRGPIAQQANPFAINQGATGFQQQAQQAQARTAGIQTPPPSGIQQAINQFGRSALTGIARMPQGVAEMFQRPMDPAEERLIRGTRPQAQAEQEVRLRGGENLRAVTAATQPVVKKIEEAIPVNEKDQGWLTSKIPAAAGSLVPMILSRGVGRITGAGSAATSGVSGAIQSTGEVSDRLNKAGVEGEKRDRAIALATASGATEALGLGRALDKIGVKQGVARRIGSVAEDAAQEYGQEYLGDVNARLVGQYDPNASLSPLSPNKLEAAALGGILGGTLQGAGAAAARIGEARDVRNVVREPQRPLTRLTDSVVDPTASVRDGYRPLQSQGGNAPIRPDRPQQTRITKIPTGAEYSLLSAEPGSPVTRPATGARAPEAVAPASQEQPQAAPAALPQDRLAGIRVLGDERLNPSERRKVKTLVIEDENGNPQTIRAILPEGMSAGQAKSVLRKAQKAQAKAPEAAPAQPTTEPLTPTEPLAAANPRQAARNENIQKAHEDSVSARAQAEAAKREGQHDEAIRALTAEAEALRALRNQIPNKSRGGRVRRVEAGERLTQIQQEVKAAKIAQRQAAKAQNAPTADLTAPLAPDAPGTSPLAAKPAPVMASPRRLPDAGNVGLVDPRKRGRLGQTEAAPIVDEPTNRLTDTDYPGGELRRTSGLRPEGQPAEIPAERMQENTNRLPGAEYAGGEVRRYTGALEGQPVAGMRRPPAPPRPAGGRNIESAPGRFGPATMSAAFPGARRGLVTEGRRVQGEIEAGRGKAGEFGKLAQSMFKSTRGDVAHGQDSFFHDPDVKGALGLRRDAEQGQVRAALKTELARVMGVKSEEVSLTQVPPQAWQNWANMKQLGSAAKQKLQTAIERYQRPIVNELQKTVAPSDSQPPRPVPTDAGGPPKAPSDYQRFRDANAKAIAALNSVSAADAATPGGKRKFDAAADRLRKSAAQMGIDPSHADAIITDAMNAQMEAARRADEAPRPSEATPAPRAEEAPRFADGDRVEVAGAQFDVVRTNADGSITLRNDQEDTWEEAPSASWRKVNAPTKKAAASESPEASRRDAYIEARQREQLETARAALAKARQAIQEHLQKAGVKLPVGISAEQYLAARVGEAKRPNRDLAALKRQLDAARESVERAEKEMADTKGGMGSTRYTHGEVHRRMVESAIAKGKPVPAEVLADYPDLAPKAPDAPPVAETQPRAVSEAKTAPIATGDAPAPAPKAKRAAKAKAAPAEKATVHQADVISSVPEVKTNETTAKSENREAATGERRPIFEPVKAGGRVARGAESTLKIPRTGQEYRVRYEVRELGDIQPSHNPHTFEKNPDYRLVNDRDYTSAANRMDVEDATKAGAFEPRLILSDDPTATNGPPVVYEGGDVLGGNSRTMMLARVYRNHPVDGQKYRRALEARAEMFGLDKKEIARMDQPILVRVIDAQPDHLQKMITDLNIQPGKAMSATEAATARAKSMPPETMRFISDRLNAEGPDATLAMALEGDKGVAILNRLIDDDVIPRGDRNRYLTDAGKLSVEAKSEIETMLLSRVFRDADQMKRAAPEMKNKLVRVAPHVAKLSGTDWDIAKFIPNAIQAAAESKAQKIDLEMLNRRGHLFGEGIQYSPEELAIARWIGELGPRQLENRFREYATAFDDFQRGQSLFGAPPNARESFDTIFKPARTGREDSQGFSFGELDRKESDGPLFGSGFGSLQGMFKGRGRTADEMHERAQLEADQAREEFAKVEKRLFTLRREIDTLRGERDKNKRAEDVAANRTADAREIRRMRPEEQRLSREYDRLEETLRKAEARAADFEAVAREEAWKNASPDRRRAMLLDDYANRGYEQNAAGDWTKDGWPTLRKADIDAYVKDDTLMDAELSDPDPEIARYLRERRGGAGTVLGSGLGSLQALFDRKRPIPQGRDLEAWQDSIANAIPKDMPEDALNRLDDVVDRAMDAAEAGDRAGWEKAKREATKILAEQSSVLQKLSTYRKAAMLSRPVTHIKNVVGNAAFQVMEDVARIPGAPVDMALSLLTGRRTLEGMNVRAASAATYEAATTGIKRAARIMREGAPEEAAEAQQHPKVTFKTPIMNKAVDFVFRALSAEDEVFFTYAYDRALREQANLTARAQAKAGLISREQVAQRAKDLRANPTEEMELDATTAAQVAVFRNRNKISDAVGGFRREIGDAGNFALDFILPFDRTPTNIILRALEYTPVGYVKNTSQALRATAGTVKEARRLRKENPDMPRRQAVKEAIDKAFTPQQQREFAQVFGRATTGSAGVISLGYMLAAKGLMTGFYDDEDKKGEMRQRAGGAQPNAIKIGGRWWSVEGLPPIGLLLGLGATIHREMHQNVRDEADRPGKVAKGAANMVTQMPLLESAKGATEMFSQPTQIGRNLGRMAASFVPGAVSDVGTLTDPYVRETGSDKKGVKKIGQEFTNEIQARIPGARRLLKPKDYGGGPVQTEWSDVIDPFASRPAQAVGAAGKRPPIKRPAMPRPGVQKQKKFGDL